jgi:hypothetical protein
LKEGGEKTMNSLWMRRFIDVTEYVIKNLVEMNGTTKEGCYVCLATDEPRILLVMEFGVCDDKQAFDFCQEKVLRVQRDNLMSSWQNRDPANKKYGGAVSMLFNSSIYDIGRDKIIGVSNFTEEQDEAAGIVIALGINWMTVDDAKIISDISKNTIAFRLYQVCRAGLF